MRDRGQIMRDEQIGEAEPRLQIAQQVEDLRPDRHVERRYRLVEHDQPRRQCERAGDRDALALPAGEFVREEVGRARRQPDQIEQLATPGRAPSAAGSCSLVTSGSAMMSRIRMRGLSEA